MGLITSLLTLPLAPVRGTVLLARTIERQATEEMHGDHAYHEVIQDLQRRHDLADEASPEFEQIEDALLDQLIRRPPSDLGREQPDGNG